MIPTRQAVIDLLKEKGPLSRTAIRVYLQAEHQRTQLDHVLWDLQCLGYVTKQGSYRTNLWTVRKGQ